MRYHRPEQIATELLEPSPIRGRRVDVAGRSKPVTYVPWRRREHPGRVGISPGRATRAAAERCTAWIERGCSGGSIMQHSIAGAYPGLLNAIQPNCSYPDTVTTFIEIADCGVLQNRYYATTNGSALSPAQRAAINGHNNTGFCNAWITSFLNAGNPSVQCNCGAGWPAALTYSTTSSPPRPNGVRCTGADHDVSMVGTFVDTDGNTKANQPGDNEGVHYGLKALRDGVISAEEFVRLNEGVGGYTADLTWTGPSPGPGLPAPRQKARESVLRTYYGGGLVSDGRQLARLAIIDLRGNHATNGDIHMNRRA